MVRKHLTIILALFLLCSVTAGCAISETDNSGKISVVTTIFPPYDFAQQVGGDNINLKMLLNPGAESHSYEPTPKDIITVQNADLFIYTGGANDTWVDDIVSSVESDKLHVLKMMDVVSVVEEELVPGMEEEHEGEDEHEGEEAEYDEHVWTSPKNAIIISKAISDKLCEIDPDNKDDYVKNTEAYMAKLNVLDGDFKKITQNASRNTIVMGDRFPFRYLADEYGLDYFAAFPGCATDVEPSASTIAFLIGKVKAENIPVVFHMEFSNQKVSKSICEATGALPLELHSCHNITANEFKNGVTYIDIMQRNAKNLEIALK